MGIVGKYKMSFKWQTGTSGTGELVIKTDKTFTLSGPRYSYYGPVAEIYANRLYALKIANGKSIYIVNSVHFHGTSANSLSGGMVNFDATTRVGTFTAARIGAKEEPDESEAKIDADGMEITKAN